MAFAPLSLKARALRLLALREHSRAELQSKLARHVQEGDDLPALLDQLQAKGFIDETQVAESHVHRRSARLGVQRLAQELRHKGLDEALVRAQVQVLRTTEFERAQAVWQRRFSVAPNSPEERARQMRFLAARGFDSQAIGQVLRAAAQAQREAQTPQEQDAREGRLGGARGSVAGVGAVFPGLAHHGAEMLQVTHHFRRVLGKLHFQHFVGFIGFARLGQGHDIRCGVMEHFVVPLQRCEAWKTPQLGTARAVNPFAQIAAVIEANLLRSKNFRGRAFQKGLQTQLPILVGCDGHLKIQTGGSVGYLFSQFFSGMCSDAKKVAQNIFKKHGWHPAGCRTIKGKPYLTMRPAGKLS